MSNSWHVYYPTTISSVIAQAAYGDSIIVHEGTYLEQVTVPSGVSLYASGEVTIDARGVNWYGSAIEINGVHDIEIVGFTILGGRSNVWSNCEGIVIRDLNNIGGTASYNITIRDCIFTGIIPRVGIPDSLGTPLVVSCYGDERLGHTSCRNIIIEDCYFYDCNPTNTNGITVGYISVIGNVEGLIIRNNYINHRYSLYNTIANGINMSGNYFGYPSQPRYLQIYGNTIEGEYGETHPSQSIYIHVTAYAVIERNYIKNWSFGPMVAAEMGSLDAFTSHDIIIRRNIIEAYYYGVTIAEWSSFYKQVYNVWVDSNTIRADVLITDATGQAPSYNLLFTNNIITGTITSTYSHDNPFYGTQTEDVVRISNLSSETPSWVTYNTIELDYNGSKDKRTKGAVEQQWMQKRTLTRRAPRY